MGGRLSVPKSPEGLSEISRPTRPNRMNINRRTIVAPLAALTMAGLVFFYSRTSIRAARLNAQRHREADGGQINWRNESLRRHGHRERVEETSMIREAIAAEFDKKSAERSSFKAKGGEDEQGAIVERGIEGAKRKK